MSVAAWPARLPLRRWWLWVILTALGVGIAVFLGSDVAITPDKARPVNSVAALASSAAPRTPPRPAPANAQTRKPAGPITSREASKPIPPTIRSSGPTLPARASWLALAGAGVAVLVLVAWRRRNWWLIAKFGWLVPVAVGVTLYAPAINWLTVGVGAGVAACLALLALIGAWENNLAPIAFIQRTTAKKARRGIQIAVLLGIAAFVYARMTGEVAVWRDPSFAAAGQMIAIAKAYATGAPVNPFEAFAALTSVAASITPLLIAGAMIAIAWSAFWLIAGGSVVGTHHACITMWRRRSTAAISHQQAYGSARVATPAEVLAALGGAGDRRPAPRRFPD